MKKRYRVGRRILRRKRLAATPATKRALKAALKAAERELADAGRSLGYAGHTTTSAAAAERRYDEAMASASRAREAWRKAGGKS